MKIRNLKATWLAVMAVLALTPAALAQTPSERIDEALTLAESQGIPVSLLESKVLEGQAKGIPMDRIATAVETRLENLEQARDAFGGPEDLDPDLLSVSADAIGAGVSGAVLAEIANTTTPDRRTVAVVALTQLVSEGVLSDDALLRVKDALARGPAALTNLASQGNAVTGGIPSSTPLGEAPSSVPPTGQPTPPDVPPSAGQPPIDIPTPPAGPGTGGPPQPPTPPAVP